MTNSEMRLNRKILFCLVGFVAGGVNAATSPVPRPDTSELERIIGNPITAPVNAKWEASEPQRTNLFIYAIERPEFDETALKRIASYFGVRGQIQSAPANMIDAPAVWIKEPNPTNNSSWRSVFFSKLTGRLSYSSGDSGHRYDPVTKRSAIRGVSDKEEAKRRALELLPLFGLSTNDIEHYPNGRIRWSSAESTTTFTHPESKERKRVARVRRVSFFQRLPGGGTTYANGNGGQFTVSFVSEGKISEAERFFRRMIKKGEAKSKSSTQISKDLENGNAWTWHPVMPSTLIVTNCVVAYPQGNSALNQRFLWPFYQVTGSSGDKAFTVFVPLDE